ncbi:hypothetical protein BOX17_05025 [Halomonas aestuarii]|uniref:DUF427 domain-containing protein n=1 Tax=Halomonas aestuarii TaxID=1897729 RepID=A0A1J0VEC1_9GAMM|nr:DUF427 domain-containing protein [Halomonas aestuarii]APE30374.1 hypothetical protein BOX17_05025 [Halomonas aestuarii]
MDDASEPSITLHPHARRIRVAIDDTLLADTTLAIELRETGYPSRQYIPRDDVRMVPLTPFETETHGPLKGNESNFWYCKHKDKAWSYGKTWRGVGRVKGGMIFYNGY